MSFINAQLDLGSLPGAEEIKLQPVNKAYLHLLRTEWLISSLFLSIVIALLIAFIPEIRSTKWWLVLAIGGIAIILFYIFFQEKSFPYLAFAVRDQDVIYRKGWLIQRIKICPYNRVQNCTIQSGPLERRWKLASLILYTAGSQGADLTIPGLLQDEAEQLRQFILSKINGTATTI